MLLWSTLATHILSVIHTLFAFMYFIALPVRFLREAILFAGDVVGKFIGVGKMCMHKKIKRIY